VTDPAKTDGSYPRYPLQICEVDAQYGYLLRDTLTTVDTRHGEESELLQLSNFSLFEDKITQNLVIMLSKIGIFASGGKKAASYSETWKYEVVLPES